MGRWATWWEDRNQDATAVLTRQEHDGIDTMTRYVTSGRFRQAWSAFDGEAADSAPSVSNYGNGRTLEKK
jgi:hypothetical protein